MTELKKLLNEFIRNAPREALVEITDGLSRSDSKRLAKVLLARHNLTRLDSLSSGGVSGHAGGVFKDTTYAEEGKWEELPEAELIADRETDPHSKTVSSISSESSAALKRGGTPVDHHLMVGVHTINPTFVQLVQTAPTTVLQKLASTGYSDEPDGQELLKWASGNWQQWLKEYLELSQDHATADEQQQHYSSNVGLNLLPPEEQAIRLLVTSGGAESIITLIKFNPASIVEGHVTKLRAHGYGPSDERLEGARELVNELQSNPEFARWYDRYLQTTRALVRTAMQEVPLSHQMTIFTNLESAADARAYAISNGLVPDFVVELFEQSRHDSSLLRWATNAIQEQQLRAPRTKDTTTSSAPQKPSLVQTVLQSLMTSGEISHPVPTRFLPPAGPTPLPASVPPAFTATRAPVVTSQPANWVPEAPSMVQPTPVLSWTVSDPQQQGKVMMPERTDESPQPGVPAFPPPMVPPSHIVQQPSNLSVHQPSMLSSHSATTNNRGSVALPAVVQTGSPLKHYSQTVTTTTTTTTSVRAAPPVPTPPAKYVESEVVEEAYSHLGLNVAKNVVAIVSPAGLPVRLRQLPAPMALKIAGSSRTMPYAMSVADNSSDNYRAMIPHASAVDSIVQRAAPPSAAPPSWMQDIQTALEVEERVIRGMCMYNLSNFFKNAGLEQETPGAPVNVTEATVTEELNTRSEDYTNVVLSAQTEVYNCVRSILTNLKFRHNVTPPTDVYRNPEFTGDYTSVPKLRMYLYRLVAETAIRMSIIAIADSMKVYTDAPMTSALMTAVESCSDPEAALEYVHFKRSEILREALNSAIESVKWAPITAEPVLRFVDHIFQTTEEQMELKHDGQDSTSAVISVALGRAGLIPNPAIHEPEVTPIPVLANNRSRLEVTHPPVARAGSPLPAPSPIVPPAGFRMGSPFDATVPTITQIRTPVAAGEISSRKLLSVESNPAVAPSVRTVEYRAPGPSESLGQYRQVYSAAPTISPSTVRVTENSVYRPEVLVRPPPLVVQPAIYSATHTATINH